MIRALAIGLVSTTLACGCAAATAPAEPAAATEKPSGFEPTTAVYQCTAGTGKVRLVTRTRPNGIHVFLPPDLDQVHLDCEHDRRASIWEHAKLSGVSFRAVGNEPGWVLEIREGSGLALSYDYGQATMNAVIQDTRSDPATRSTRYTGFQEDRRIEVRLVGERCSDTMADEVYPTRVEITFDDRRLTGCGRPLH